MSQTAVRAPEPAPVMRTVLTYKSGAVRILGMLPASDLRPTVMLQTRYGLLSACLVKVTPLAAHYRELERTWKENVDA